MNDHDFEKRLGIVRASLDQFMEEEGNLISDETTLDQLLPYVQTIVPGKTGLEDVMFRETEAFVNDYVAIAVDHHMKVKELDKRTGWISRRPRINIPRLVYHTIIPGMSLWFIVSSVEYGAVAAGAGFLAEAANQKWWNRAASPATAGWWGLFGGIAGAVVDYFAHMSMPFFTYIAATGAGMVSAVAQVNKVIYRDMPWTLAEERSFLQEEFQKKGNILVQRYASKMEKNFR